MKVSRDSDAPQPAQQVSVLPPLRNNRLDIHRIGDIHLGIFREPFDRVIPLDGFQLRPLGSALTIWNFQHPATGAQGRLMDVAGFLQEDHVMLSDRGLAYMVREHGRMLALMLPRAPRKIKLTQANYKMVPHKDEEHMCPDNWPRGLVGRVIRNWMQVVVIVDEKYLLSRLTR